MEKENHIKGMFGSIYPKHYSRYPGVVQLVERLIWDQEDFAGSSPAYHTIKKKIIIIIF